METNNKFGYKPALLFILILFAIIGGIAFLLWPENYIIEPGKPTEVVETLPEVAMIKGLKTCQVCGYDALEKVGKACNNCDQVLNKQEIEDAMLLDMTSLIIQKQLDYFMPDTLGKPIDFLNPTLSAKGYPKNPSWRPKVLENEVFEYHRALLEIQAGVKK